MIPPSLVMSGGSGIIVVDATTVAGQAGDERDATERR